MRDYSRFSLSARRVRRGFVAPFVRRQLRRRRTHPFGYYINVVQLNSKFIQTFNPSGKS